MHIGHGLAQPRLPNAPHPGEQGRDEEPCTGSHACPFLRPPAPDLRYRLAEALEHSAQSFVLFDADGRLVHANARTAEFLPGLAAALEPGLPLDALVRHHAAHHPSLNDETAREDWAAARLARCVSGAPDTAPGEGPGEGSGGEAADAPFTMLTAEGRWLQVDERATPDGGRLIIHTDVTALKRSEELLRAREAEARAARQEAERANRAKSVFLAHMSHELRTPLNAVLGFAELLLDETFGPLGSPRYRSYAADIRDGGRHLLSLINDLLDLSRIEAGRHEFLDEAIEVRESVHRAIMMLSEAAARRGVHLVADLPGELPFLLGDARALRQMLLNLLSNAVKFTPSGGQVVLTAGSLPGGGIGLMVADTGVGIAPEDMGRVLEPFGRGDITLARESEGTGLGLPIVQRLIERHGGRLDLSSEPGVGTTAILLFPPERSVPRIVCPPPDGQP